MSVGCRKPKRSTCNTWLTVHLQRHVGKVGPGTRDPSVGPIRWAYGVVVSMFNFHRSDRGSNPGRGGKIS